MDCTSLSKSWVGQLFDNHVYSDLMPSKQIIGQTVSYNEATSEYVCTCKTCVTSFYTGLLNLCHPCEHCSTLPPADMSRTVAAKIKFTFRFCTTVVVQYEPSSKNGMKFYYRSVVRSIYTVSGRAKHLSCIYT